MYTVDISIREVPDRGAETGADFEYPRVVGFNDPNSTYTELVDVPSHLRQADGEERVLTLPFTLGQHFLWALRRMGDPRRDGFNCHGFAVFMVRGMAGFGSAIADFDPEKFSEVPDMRLEMGRIGVIGNPEQGGVHSVVGLGMDSDESLQVLSGGRGLTVVETAKVVESYRRVRPAADLYLYEPSNP